MSRDRPAAVWIAAAASHAASSLGRCRRTPAQSSAAPANREAASGHSQGERGPPLCRYVHTYVRVYVGISNATYKTDRQDSLLAPSLT